MGWNGQTTNAQRDPEK